MIDMHCHILHGIDDGARSIEESVALCIMAAENSIDKIVLTPHFTVTTPCADFVRHRDRRIDELRRALDERKIDIELYAGAEVFVNDEIFFSQPLEGITLNGSRYLLIEFDFRGLNAERLMKYVREIRKRDFVPIIAHPERYRYTQENYDIVNMLADNGVLMQLNSLSLTGALGVSEFDLAYAMVQSSLAAFVASDAHSLHRRANDILKQSQYFPQDITAAEMDRMMSANPLRVIEDKEIRFPHMTPIRKSRLLWRNS